MLLRLVPDSPNPSVHFAVNFENLDERIPLATNWNHQLHGLAVDDLELPKHVHALDKAAMLPCILREVTFNIPQSTIICTFLDDWEESFELSDPCLALLQAVIDDVNESSALLEDEDRQRAQLQELVKKRQHSESLNSPPSSVKVKTHKKQRSLLMSLVASIIIPLSSGSSRHASPVNPDPEAYPSSPTPTSPSSPKEAPFVPSEVPRLLRRRARSTLVDAFRLAVTSQLSTRLPAGGFYTWIVESMLRRVTAQMEKLVSSSGVRPSSFPHLRDHFQSTDSVPPSLVSSEDDQDIDTDTDWSSVKTPSSQHSSPSWIKESPDGVNTRHTKAESGMPSEIVACKMLSDACMRLRHLLDIAHARQIHSDSERRQREAMLEIKSRRRAWLNKSLGGACQSSMDFGFSQPFRSSRIAQTSWSGEDYEYVGCDPEEFSIVFEDYEDYEKRLSLGLRKAKSDSRLLSVSEDPEDLEDEMQMLTMDDHWPPRRPVDTIDDVEPVPELPVIATRRRALSASSVLRQPSAKPREQNSTVHMVQGNRLDYSFSGDNEEFTLAMDIPFSVRIEDQAIFERPKLRSSNDFPISCENDGDWLPHGPVTVECLA